MVEQGPFKPLVVGSSPSTSTTNNRREYVKPFDARVIIKKPERQEQTASGIILPDTAAEQGQTAEGIVISVGRGSRNMTTGEWMPIPLKEGDRIIYSKFSAQEVQFEEEEYFIVAERDIVAVVMK